MIIQFVATVRVQHQPKSADAMMATVIGALCHTHPTHRSTIAWNGNVRRNMPIRVLYISGSEDIYLTESECHPLCNEIEDAGMQTSGMGKMGISQSGFLYGNFLLASVVLSLAHTPSC